MSLNERRKRAAEEAAEWWVQINAPGSSPHDRAQFADWLRESPVHVAEMLRVAQVHSLLEGFEGWENFADPVDSDGCEIIEFDGAIRAVDVARQSREDESPRRRMFAVAASIAATVLLSATYLGITAGNVIETDRGERRELTLDDGSILQIDPDTTLRIQYEDAERRIRIEKGRALFRVAKDRKRPFLVFTDDAVVRAVGTQFGVDQTHRDVVVTVREGLVSVRDQVGFRAKATRETLVPAGHQLVVREAGGVSPVREVNASLALAWADGRLVFDRASVAEVVREFNRYNNVQIRVENAVVLGNRISGTFDAADPESFVAFVQSMIPVDVVRDGKGTIVIQ